MQEQATDQIKDLRNNIIKLEEKLQKEIIQRKHLVQIFENKYNTFEKELKEFIDEMHSEFTDIKTDTIPSDINIELTTFKLNFRKLLKAVKSDSRESIKLLSEQLALSHENLESIFNKKLQQAIESQRTLLAQKFKNINKQYTTLKDSFRFITETTLPNFDKRLTSSINKMQNTVNRTQNELKSLDQRVQKNSNDLDKKFKAVQEFYKKENVLAADKLKEFESKITETDEKINTFKKEIQEKLQKSVASNPARNSIQKELNSINENIKLLENIYSGIESKITQTDKKIEVLNKLNNGHKQLVEAVSNLQLTSNRLNSKISQIFDNFKAISINEEATSKKIESLEEIIFKAKKEIELSNTESINKFQELEKTTSESISNIKEKITRIESKITQVISKKDKELKEANRRIEELEKSSKELEAKNILFENELKELKDSIDLLLMQ